MIMHREGKKKKETKQRKKKRFFREKKKKRGGRLEAVAAERFYAALWLGPPHPLRPNPVPQGGK
jgi:hypothetical protein